MVGNFLPDTNVLIYSLKGIEPYASWFKKTIQEEKIKISVIVIAEFLQGSTKEDEAILKILLDKFECLSVDRKIAEIGASYKKGFVRKTKKVWMSDCLIAATCKLFDLTLVTADKKDYPMKDIKILNL
ncbi:MAG: PIN domain-containing protein [Patescibacteria group bacterium]